jgi:hypothetical protein
MRWPSASLPVLLVLVLVLGSASLSEAQASSGKLAPFTCFFNECAVPKSSQDSFQAMVNCLKSGRQAAIGACAQTAAAAQPPPCLPHMPLNVLAACCPWPAAFPAATAKVVLPGSPAFAEAKA